MSKTLTQNEIIKRFVKIHNNIYDYSLVNFKSTHKSIDIICKKHGIFNQLVKNHLKGTICPKCNSENRRLKTEDFISKSVLVHDNTYDYSKTDCIKSNIKVEIICKKHGSFWQTPNGHLSGNGCFFCQGEKTANRCRLGKEEFVKRSKIIHNNYYNYNLVEYKNNSEEVKIICPIHGIFYQIPSVHLIGSGCSKCVSHISKPEADFLKYLNITCIQKYIKPYKVDGYDLETKTVYEFLGDYWHGNPKRFKKNDLNKLNGKTFGVLYEETKRKFDHIKKMGYNIMFIWEQDWNKFLSGETEKPNILIWET